METELLQGMIEIIFKGNLLYLSPILFILMITLFADQLISLISHALTPETRRNRY